MNCKSRLNCYWNLVELSLVVYPMALQFCLLKKKGGVGLRMCTDYHSLNSSTVLDSWPLPRIDEMLARLKGARFFSKLDLREGYH